MVHLYDGKQDESLALVSLVKQGTLTRPEHLVPPTIHNALMFGGSTCCEIYVYI